VGLNKFTKHLSGIALRVKRFGTKCNKYCYLLLQRGKLKNTLNII
jgi:hypothetical protein